MTARVRVAIRGAVQGVGFRPFVYRLARELRLAGWVNNSPRGVTIEVEGGRSAIELFLDRLGREHPPRAVVQGIESTFLDPASYTTFEIRESDSAGERSALILPDIATCAACVRELFDPADRRYRYPFLNCTHCGPRYTIIEALPYDRAHTAMRRFTLCASCRAEYDDPGDRRFHAQPTACPACGPRLALRGRGVDRDVAGEDALRAATAAVADGAIVAVKGLGGFHLIVDAANDAAVRRLRERKHREEKPLALLAPHLAWVEESCVVSAAEERLLTSPEAPIVLLRRRPGAPVAPSVAPRNPWLGVMLPYTPLHHLLLHDLGRAVVATSGNRSDEPICTDDDDALKRLDEIADFWLVHDRPILRHVDDSIARVVLGREQVIRRARGYAPLPFSLPVDAPPTLAVGAHLKNTVALTVGREVFLGPHIGDLDNREATAAFERTIETLEGLYGVRPSRVALDPHPDYRSSRAARALGIPAIEVQHHFAHVAACMSDNGIDGPVLGVAWDGTGYGEDGTIWGGEFLLTDGASFSRAASLRSFLLPGNERAVREPRRSAFGLLFEILGEAAAGREGLAPIAAFSLAERAVITRMLARGLQSPRTTSAGRLFDAVASLLGIRHESRFEGQAAMELEFEADRAHEEGGRSPVAYPLPVAGPEGGLLVLDWEPCVRAIIADLAVGSGVEWIALRFHLALAEGIAAVARRVGRERVVLSGGCFQNRLLLEHAVERLETAGFRAYWHQRVPANDGGIALGQATVAAYAGTRREGHVSGSAR